MPRLFFIVGRGRSGTTLFGRHLDTVAEACVAPESMFALSLQGRYGRVRFDAAAVERFCEDAFRDERIRNWSFDRAQLADFIRAHAAPGTGFPEICRLVYAAQAHFAGKPKARVSGDKNPHYSLFIERLAALFPEAPFIHLVRDPRANVASYLQVPFDSSSIGTLAWRWRLYNEAILRAVPRLGARYRMLRFEDFVADGGGAVRGTLGFLGALAPTVATGEIKLFAHQRRMDWHKRLDTRLDPKVLSAWQEHLDGPQTALIEHVCGDLMQRFAYPVTRSGTPRRIRSWAARLNAIRTVEQERIIFRLPFAVRTWIITFYRYLTGTI